MARGHRAEHPTPEWRTEPPPAGWNASPSDEHAPNHKMLVVSGVLAILAGTAAILVPALASVGMAVFLGCMLLILSAALAIGALAMEGVARKLLRGLVAFLTFAAGVYLIASPLEGAFTLTVMLVIWFVMVGVTRVATGIAELGQPGAGYTIFAGVVSLVLGLLIGAKLPSSADWAIGLLVGIDFLTYGLVCLGRAWLPAARVEATE